MGPWVIVRRHGASRARNLARRRRNLARRRSDLARQARYSQLRETAIRWNVVMMPSHTPPDVLTLFRGFLPLMLGSVGT